MKRLDMTAPIGMCNVCRQLYMYRLGDSNVCLVGDCDGRVYSLQCEYHRDGSQRFYTIGLSKGERKSYTIGICRFVIKENMQMSDTIVALTNSGYRVRGIEAVENLGGWETGNPYHYRITVEGVEITND